MARRGAPVSMQTDYDDRVATTASLAFEPIDNRVWFGLGYRHRTAIYDQSRVMELLGERFGRPERGQLFCR
jgi:hypothetical protein